jgi:drug/metabolite transporter (DMT)-like permease
MAIIHRQPPDGFRLSLVCAGFAGALMVAQPGGADSSPFALLAFFTALFAATRDLAGGHIPEKNAGSCFKMVTVLLVMVAALAANMVAGEWRMPESGHVLSLSVAGLLMALGHVFTFLTYKRAEAQAVAPFYYAFMIWALILGLLLFGERPDTQALSGMALILLSGIAIIWRERRVAPIAHA